MKNNKKIVNSLIKRNHLIKILKNAGIKRFNKEALKKLEKELENDAKRYATALARKLLIEGRKTLTKKEIRFIMGEKEEKKEEYEI
ncbi:MAG: hypothetical protein AABY06_00160 [Nanoarchaeota archaeon]